MLWIKNIVNKEFAVIKNDDGKTIARKRFKLQDKKFIWKDKTFNVIRHEKYRDFSRGFMKLTKYYTYYYNVNNSNPMTFTKTSNGFEPTIDNTLYTKLLDAEILVKLNTVNSGLFGSLKDLNAQTIIGILIVIGVIVYLVMGGSLT